MNEPPNPPSTGQVILYQTEDGTTRLEVRFRGETAWLSLNQITELFQRWGQFLLLTTLSLY